MSKEKVFSTHLEPFLQIYRAPVYDHDLLDNKARDAFVRMGWVARCHGWNILTDEGERVFTALNVIVEKVSQ